MDQTLVTAVDNLIEKIIGQRNHIWTWRHAANHFIFRAAQLSRKYDITSSDIPVTLPNKDATELLSYILAAERCLAEIERLRQARDSRLRL
jgi:hypothetical protein